MGALPSGLSQAELERLGGVLESALAEQERRKDDPTRFGIYRSDPYGFFADVFGILRWDPGEPDVPGLTPDQCDLIDALVAGETDIVIRSGHSTGKAMPHSLVVDTPAGKARWGELAAGDRLFGSDGRPTEVLRVWPQGEREMVRVTFSDGTSTRCDWDHLWSVRGRSDRRHGLPGWRTLTTRQLFDSGLQRSNGRAQANVWEIPVLTAPLAYPHSPTEVDPYAVGGWLGDGCRGTGYITSGADDVAHWLSQIPGSRCITSQPCVLVPGMRKWARARGLMDRYAHEKAVPDELLYGSPSQRLALLQGLMDADGTVDKRNATSFTTTSPVLRDQVAWLVRSLGGIATTGSVKRPFYRTPSGERVDGRLAYTVGVQMPVCPFRLARKVARWSPPRRGLHRFIVAIEPDGVEEASCVTVAASDHCYVANDGIVTHNTFILALVVLWWIYSRESKVVTTASTWTQVEKMLWGEIAKLHSQARVHLPGDLITTELRVKRGAWFAVGLSVEDATAFQGYHHPQLLVIVDEAPGVSPVIHEAIGSLATAEGNVTIKVGNPTESAGPFYEHFRKGSWHRLHFSPFRHPNIVTGREVIPGAVTQKWIEKKKADWGEHSPIYASRVLGEFPEAGVKAVIAMKDAEACMAPAHYEAIREQVNDAEPVILACDVARFGDDRTTIALRKGPLVLRAEAIDPVDLMDLVGQLRNLRRETGAELVVVDVVALGAGVVDRLMELGEPVVGFHSGARAAEKSLYQNRRAEMWFRLRRKLERRELALPVSDTLLTDLTAPTWTTHSSGKIKIESKDDMKRRGEKSTDLADAVIMTLAAEADFEDAPPEPEWGQDPVTLEEPLVASSGPLDQYGGWV